ncbi:LOW QUALITY PROTEIN: bone morphogenetic protein 8B-like, partial [Canis lupus familiaris]|uniref:LOW QUALITY PROTEIN: bone morphogenetic protein 8B-like n=1 Tax=Canis lupus familiaris TaxID=9615 RepID=UPI0018F3A835
PGPLWLVGLALCALSGGGPGPRPPAGCPARRLAPRERRDMQREILAVLGLPGRPRPRAPPAAARLPASAPLFMLGLYRAMARDDHEDGGPPARRPGRADLVMSFVNVVERDRTLGHQEPHWKEFHFDLTQIAEGAAVTAAEFPDLQGWPAPTLLNRTLHVKHVRGGQGGQSNRESDLFFLDLLTLRAADRWLVLVLDVTAASGRWCWLGVPGDKDLGLFPPSMWKRETEDGRSVDPGLAGLLGRRAPRSKQPFLVTFFRASPGPVRAPRAARPLKRRPPKKSNELPHPNRLPGIFDDVHGTDGRQVCRRHELYVSFQDLGWLDWVIAPQGYSAYYCEGECSFPLDSCMNATNHAILQSLVSTASVLPGPTGRGLAAPGGWQPRVSGRLCAQELPCVHEQFRAHACSGAGAWVAELCVHLHPHTPTYPDCWRAPTSVRYTRDLHDLLSCGQTHGTQQTCVPPGSLCALSTRTTVSPACSASCGTDVRGVSDGRVHWASRRMCTGPGDGCPAELLGLGPFCYLPSALCLLLWRLVFPTGAVAPVLGAGGGGRGAGGSLRAGRSPLGGALSLPLVASEFACEATRSWTLFLGSF